MAQKQETKEHLICTFMDCRELQSIDGEFCKKHYPQYIKVMNKRTQNALKNLIVYCDNTFHEITSDLKIISNWADNNL